ncbi:hypothetical protein KP79_PYT25570 [Mizuhopecten yessoensis]|uniref:CCHC-type domain-containing protein n=1 Tax=Mizuhopecten yessoensis TaxID=6573 RepID=A0A210QT42_MIZYE|nr:hypothetical protein KP79_PYT25570 [Mizuhopecten yessoensis]
MSTDESVQPVGEEDTPSTATQDNTACPWTGGSGDTSEVLSMKRAGPEVDEEEFQVAKTFVCFPSDVNQRISCSWSESSRRNHGVCLRRPERFRETYLVQGIPCLVVSLFLASMADKHIDLDVLRRSVRFQVTGSRNNTVTRFEIVKALTGSGLQGTEIQAIFRCEGPSTWFATLATQDLADSIVEEGYIENQYFTLHPEWCDRRRLTIRVQWLPIWLVDDVIASHFHGFYGTVVNNCRETTSVGGVLLEMGTRIITLVIREGDQDRIHHRTILLGKSALIMVPGRPPICLRCQQIGHVRSQCPGTGTYYETVLCFEGRQYRGLCYIGERPDPRGDAGGDAGGGDAG